jgi:DNA polymerase III subunit delta'
MNAPADDGSDDGIPARALFDDVVGQPQAVSLLRTAARRPVHAYLVVGPPGLGQRALVRGFAAALLCPDGGCGHCDVCDRARRGVHPDLVEVERAGPFVTVDDARRVVRLAQRRPLEGRRQVVSVADAHLARLAVPVLLKTLEEPAGPTVFVLLADFVPDEMATLASRCVRIDLRPVPPHELGALLRARGVPEELAGELADAAGGSVERAQLLAADPGLVARRTLWRSVPTRLDGTGAAAASLAAELLASAEDAVQPLRDRHHDELEELAPASEQRGERGTARRKEIEDRHQREERRWRTDELRAGFAVLAAAYRDRLVSTAAGETEAEGAGRVHERLSALCRAIDVVERSSAELVRNPNESLLLEAMLVRLSAVPG